MIDLALERAVRELARNAGVSREELLQAIVRDWLIENQVLRPKEQPSRLVEGLH